MIERIHRRPIAKLFEGQIAPDLPMMSSDNVDWYKEMIRRSKEGYSYRGDRFTGDQWWFYNLCPMAIMKLDKNGVPTKEFDMGFPYWSQEDDYLFKQIEEADQSDKGVFLMTGRGYGKTQIVISIGGKIFFLTKNAHGVISASGDAHADATWIKFQAMISAVGRAHPTLAANLLKENTEQIVSGREVMVNGKWDDEIRALWEKIVYGNLPGKTKGRRLHYQHYEEVGDWTGAATLKDCIAASEETYYIGSTKKCRDFYTGTGGTVFSSQAKEISLNPDSFNLYKVYDWHKRGTSIVIPAFAKYGGFWEKDGISDKEGAKAFLQKRRDDKLKDTDPLAYTKFTQEQPFTFDEMFAKSGGNRFDQEKIAKNIVALETNPDNVIGEHGDLIWRRKDGEIIGVDWQADPNGKIWILEKPFLNEAGIAWPRLYVGGYDGIDIGVQDSSSGVGSFGAISIKKRLLPGSGLNNVYVCHYRDRPKDVDELFENCWKIMYYFNAITNIEDSKRGIVGFLKQKKSLRFLMPRPRLTLDPNANLDKESKLIGTTPTTKNFEYGENFLINHIKDYGDSLVYMPVLIDLRDFTMSTRTEHDYTVSMFMAEIADDEFMDRILTSKPAMVVMETFGYYTDRNGKKRYGKIPDKKNPQFNFAEERIAETFKGGKLLDQHGEEIN